MSRDLIERSRGKWRSILIEAGIHEEMLTGKHTACPICGGKDRFRFDDKNGSGSWFCNNCGSGYGVHLLQKLCGIEIGAALHMVDEAIGRATVVSTVAKTAARPDLKQAREIWDQSKANGSIIATYLAGRGLTLNASPLSIRQHDQLLYLDEDGEFRGRMPAMVALIKGHDGKPTGIHRTYLTKAGDKASVPSPKKIMGKQPDGAAVRLSEYSDVLGIAEGIETALAASTIFNIPTWAALTAGGVERWMPPRTVPRVSIFGDNDANFRGQQAAFNLAHRLTRTGYRVEVHIPDRPGEDWNDVLRGVA